MEKETKEKGKNENKDDLKDKINVEEVTQTEEIKIEKEEQE